MKSKSEITLKELLFKIGALILSAVAFVILIIRRAGEGAGESVATAFVKESDTATQKEKKNKFGKLTGSLICSLLTLGVIGTYIVDAAEAHESVTEKEPPKPETEGQEAIEAIDISEQTPEPLFGEENDVPTGADINGDGVADFVAGSDGWYVPEDNTAIYVNSLGEQIGSLVYIDGYQKESGESVAGYFRTVADETVDNNLRVS